MTRATIRSMLLWGAVVVTLFPFFWMVCTSFKSLEEATTATLWPFPEAWLWQNYPDALSAAPFGRYFYNTAIVAFVTTTSVVLTSLFAGYAFARIPFRGRGVLFGAVLATMMIPFEVTLIPNFIFITELGWYNRFAALIVPWCTSAFSIFLVRQAFLSIPQDFFDAARVDGCGHVQFVVLIGAQLVRPALATVALFSFLASYNALLWPLVVTGDDSMRVVQVGLTVFSGADGVRVPLLMAASVIIILPTVALYFFAQRQFLDSAIGAAIKS